MYQQNGTFYSEDYSVSFGDLASRTVGGVAQTVFNPVANTWTSWHLIPEQKPVIANPVVNAKFVKVPGSDGMLNLTEYLTGEVNYARREGTLSFIIDNDHEPVERIREKIVDVLHGKVIKMQLSYDARYYYEGRFSVGEVVSGADYSRISINYKLNPYKLSVDWIGSNPVLWDPFNFETDYDYSALLSTIEVNNQTKNYTIYADDYRFNPNVICALGIITVRFAGVTKTISAGQTAVLGRSKPGANILTVSGTGSATIRWRGGKL